jgi:hypothetical protein
MATNKISTLITILAEEKKNAKTPLNQTYAAPEAAKGAPQASTMEESACSSYAKIAAERTAFGLTGGGIGFGASYLCGGPSALMTAIGAGLCLLGGKEAVECCFSKCDDRHDSVSHIPTEAVFRHTP